MKVGFYGGDPRTITDDLAILKPTFFPSVPRLFNRVYGGIKTKINDLNCCLRCVANMGVQKKLTALRTTGSLTNDFYDKKVFMKMK